MLKVEYVETLNLKAFQIDNDNTQSPFVESVNLFPINKPILYIIVDDNNNGLFVGYCVGCFVGDFVINKLLL